MAVPSFTLSADQSQSALRMWRRFWSKVAIGAPDECWLWQAGRNKQGYGRFTINGLGARNAQRVALHMTTGVPLETSLHGCHDCDTPACVNLAHLWWGTSLQNNHDMIAKGRQVVGVGEESPSFKLTETQVREIVSRCQTGSESGRQIAADYGVDPGTIYALLKGKSWRHLGVAGSATLTRSMPGERNGRAKLTQELAAEIRAAHAAGASGKSLARKYGVGGATISRVTRGECWAA